MNENTCELCGREEDLTKHHLIPQKLHTKKRFRRGYSKKDLMENVAWLCRPCHTHIHVLFTELQLGSNYSTVNVLAADEKVQKWVTFICTKPKGYKPKVDGRPRRG